MTAEYTARTIPGCICAVLYNHALLLGTDSINNKYHERISALLLEEIETFDREIGEAVIALCKKPKKLTEGQARDIVEKHSEVLGRAYHGTTLALALVNRTREDLWVAGVGDSTVGEFGQIA